jgi:hypothetical protein
MPAIVTPGRLAHVFLVGHVREPLYWLPSNI